MVRKRLPRRRRGAVPGDGDPGATTASSPMRSRCPPTRSWDGWPIFECQGTIEEATAIGSIRSTPVRISVCSRCRARTLDLDVAVAGDIAIVSKIDEVKYGVFHSEVDGQLLMNTIAQPKPMFGLAIEVTSKGGDEASEAISKMIAEDQTLELEHRRDP